MFEARDKFLNCVRLCCSEKNYTPEAAIMIMCCAKRTLPALDPVYYNSQGFFFSFLLNCWIEQSFHPLSICSIWTSEMRNNVRRSNWHQKLHFHILRGSFPIARFNFTSGFMRNGCRRVADAIIAQSQSLKRIQKSSFWGKFSSRIINRLERNRGAPFFVPFVCCFGGIKLKNGATKPHPCDCKVQRRGGANENEKTKGKRNGMNEASGQANEAKASRERKRAKNEIAKNAIDKVDRRCRAQCCADYKWTLTKK